MKQQSIEQAFILNPHASFATLNDAYHDRFAKLAALVHIALNDSFNENSKENIYHYLSLTQELVEDLRSLQEIINQKDKKAS